MQQRKRKNATQLNIKITLLLCVVMILLASGITYGRYEGKSENISTMKVTQDTGQVYLTKIESDESTSANKTVMNYTLSNGKSKNNYSTVDQTASIYMFATVGLTDSSGIKVTFKEGNVSYTAECTKVTTSMPIYEQYGPGWIYRFYDETGKEATWNLPGSAYVTKTMCITVKGTSQYPTIFRVFAEGKPGLTD